MDTRRDIPQRYAAVLLLLILAVGAWARFDGLGRFSFWTDEMYHVIGAQSFLESGEPIVPAYRVYWRAFLTTLITATSFKLFGVSEFSARLPFALISLIFLGVAYRIVSARFSRLIGLTTVFFLALTPHILQIGRDCRMYGPMVLLYFIGVFMVYRALESSPGKPRRRPKAVAVGLIAAAPVFALAASQQYLAVNFGMSLALYCLLMAGWVWRERGAGDALRSRYCVLIYLMLAGGLAVVVLLPAVVDKFVRLARTPMEWDTRGHPAPFYIWLFQYHYKVLMLIYPLGAVLLVRRYGRLGVFIVCAFVPVMLAHMYVFTSRGAERYLTYILPLFFVTSACVVESLIWWVVGVARDQRANGARVTAAAVVLAALPAGWVFTYPWLNSSIERVRYGVGPDWKQLSGELERVCDQGVVLTTWPREVTFYGGRFPDYVVTQTYEYFGEEDHTVVIGDRVVQVNYLLDIEALNKALASGGPVYFITTDWAFYNDALVSSSMRDAVLSSMQELASSRSGNDRVVIYQAHDLQP